MEAYYRDGLNPVTAWVNYCQKSQASTAFISTYEGGDYEAAVEAQELGTGMLTAYMEHYSDDYIEPIAVELPFSVNLGHLAYSTTIPGVAGEVSVDKVTSRYVGTIDLIFRDKRDGKVYLMDHKTAKALGSANTQYLPLDDQAGAYMAFATKILREKGLIEEKEKVAGIVYNYLVKRMPDIRPTNEQGFACNKPQKRHYIAAFESAGITLDVAASKLKVADLEAIAEQHDLTVLGEVSQQQPLPMFDRVVVRKTPHQMAKQVQRAKDDLQSMSLVYNNVMAPTKTPTRNCGFCPFNMICETDENGLPYDDMVEAGYETWDPYQSHEEEK